MVKESQREDPKGKKKGHMNERKKKEICKSKSTRERKGKGETEEEEAEWVSLDELSNIRINPSVL